MFQTPKSSVFALALLSLLLVGAVIAAENPLDSPQINHTAPTPVVDAEQIEKAEGLEGHQEPEVNPMNEIEDCQLQCLQAFTACRQAAGNSGPGFPAGAYEECVNEHERCLAEECGIGC